MLINPEEEAPKIEATSTYWGKTLRKGETQNKLTYTQTYTVGAMSMDSQTQSQWQTGQTWTDRHDLILCKLVLYSHG